jgi:hypothetical protein
MPETVSMTSGGASIRSVIVYQQFNARFRRGSKVVIDNDKSIIAIVTAHLFRGDICTVECTWFSNGDLKTCWIEEWRLSDGRNL